MHLILGDRKQVEDLGVVVNGLVEATVVALDDIVHKLLYAAPLACQLYEKSLLHRLACFPEDNSLQLQNKLNAPYY